MKDQRESLPQQDPICVVRAVQWDRATTLHWLERYDEFLLGLLDAGEWEMLVYFKIICFIMYSVTVCAGCLSLTARLMMVTRFKIKRSACSS